MSEVVINCYQCGTPVPKDSGYTAFCGEECWEKYNKERPIAKPKSTGIDYIKQRCAEIANSRRMLSQTPKTDTTNNDSQMSFNDGLFKH